MAMKDEKNQENLSIEERMRRNIQLEKEGKLLTDTLPLPIKQEVLDRLKGISKSSEYK